MYLRIKILKKRAQQFESYCIMHIHGRFIRIWSMYNRKPDNMSFYFSKERERRTNLNFDKRKSVDFFIFHAA